MFRRYNGRHVMIRAVRALSVQARIGIAASTLAGLSVVGLMFANAASASTRLGGVDMQRACSVQWAKYGPTTAVVRDQHNAYSWACRSNSTSNILGGVSVNQECVLQYGLGAYAGLGSASNPYSWYCQGPAPAPTPTQPAVNTGKTLTSNSGDKGNCTWWALNEFHQFDGLYPDTLNPANTGDAKYWATNAGLNGWTVTSTPRVDSIAVFQPGANGAFPVGAGHVAWVTAVSGSQITVTEMNFEGGSPPGGFNKVDTRTLTPASSVLYILAP